MAFTIVFEAEFYYFILSVVFLFTVMIFDIYYYRKTSKIRQVCLKSFVTCHLVSNILFGMNAFVVWVLYKTRYLTESEFSSSNFLLLIRIVKIYILVFVSIKISIFVYEVIAFIKYYISCKNNYDVLEELTRNSEKMK